MGHTSGALAPRNSAGCVRRRLYVIFLFTFDWRGSDPTPVGCHCVKNFALHVPYRLVEQLSARVVLTSCRPRLI